MNITKHQKQIKDAVKYSHPDHMTILSSTIHLSISLKA